MSSHHSALHTAHNPPLTAAPHALSGRQQIPCSRKLPFICRAGSLRCHQGRRAGGSRDCLDELALVAAAHSCELACPGTDCPEAYHLKKHCPESFFGLQHTLPPAGPKTSSAERDETRTQSFLQYRCLKDVSEFGFVAVALLAESHPGSQWQFEQANHQSPCWIS